MQILPVLDVMHGQVVRGCAGEREAYQPIQSVLTKSSQPFDVASAIHLNLGLSQFYLADLDAIQFGRPNTEIIKKISDSFPGMWLDCGIRDPHDVVVFRDVGDLVFVVGLETVSGPETIRNLCRQLGSERIVFSLDLKCGKPLGNLSTWRAENPAEIAAIAFEMGVRKMIVLDLAGVGMGEGLSTVELCQSMKADFPDLFLVTGGGIRDADDLFAVPASAVDGVLLASAIHNGNISAEEISKLSGRDRSRP